VGFPWLFSLSQLSSATTSLAFYSQLIIGKLKLQFGGWTQPVNSRSPDRILPYRPKAQNVASARSAVLLGVLFRCVFVMFSRVQMMTMRHRGVVGRFFVVAGLVVLCGFAALVRKLKQRGW
jgi:hypothetical protein